METKINLASGLIGAIATIITSVGGSYVTTKVTLARHDLKIETLENKMEKLESNINSNKELLIRIDKSVAIIEERTKEKSK
jgi:RNA binding exosome subunit